jgi:WD40 repeat protein
MKKLYLLITMLLSCTVLYAQTPTAITIDNAEVIRQIGQVGEGYLNEFTFSPDGRTVVFAGSLGLWVYDMTTPENLPRRVGENALYSVSYNHAGTKVATGGVLGMVEIWDATTWTPLYEIPIHPRAVRHVRFSPLDSQLLVTAGDTVYVLNVEMGSVEHKLTGHKRPIYDVAYNANGTQIATASFDDTVKLWDARTGDLLMTITENTESVLCVKYNPDGNLVASSSYDGMVRIFDSATGELLQTLEGHTQVPYDIVYNEDGRTLFTIAMDNTVCSWDVATGDVTETWQVPPVSEFTQHPDGRLIMLNSYENPVRVWDLETDETLLTFDGTFLPPFHTMSYSADENQLRVGAFDDGVWVWDVATWELMGIEQGVMERADAVATTFEGDVIATALENGDIALTNADGAVLATLVGHTMRVVGLVFMPDDSQLISVGSDGTIRAWGLPQS